MNKKRSSSLIAGLGALLLVTQAQAQETLYLFNWSEYMDPDIIRQFEQRYDVRVVQSYYGSLGEMFSRLQSGGTSQFDIIVPSNYYVPRLIGAGLVQPLDKSQLPHAGNVIAEFADPGYDPGLQYSMPYQWGTTGIVYDTTVFPNAAPSWSLLFDPEVNPQQPFAVQQDGQVMIGAACAYLGKGGDCTSLDDWREAARLMLQTRQRANFSGFVDGTPVLQQVARGTLKAGITYNGDFLLKKSEDPEGFANLAFMLPEEGAEMWVDSMMIPSHAPNPELAHKFIDFILEPEIGAQLSNYNQYSSPNHAAEPLLDAALREPPALPSDEQMTHLYFSPSLEGAQLQQFQQLWTEVRSR